MSHSEEQVELIKRFSENGYPILVMDFENGGSQLPLHIGLLARIPFIAANSGLTGKYFDNTYLAMHVLKHSRMPNKDSHISYLASGQVFGSLCLREGDYGYNFTSNALKDIK